MAKFLITGGDGYLAQHVINLLLSKGHAIIAIDDGFNQLQVPDEYEPLLERFIFSLLNKKQLDNAFTAADVCIHLASPAHVMPDGLFNSSVLTDKTLHEVAIVEGLNVFHAAIDSNVPVIFTSTDSVYGPNISAPLYESAQMMPINLMGVHKLSLEHHARVLGLTHGLNSISMRLFNVYGMWRPNWESDVISQFCRSALVGDELVVHGNGEQVRDFIHVSDVARAFYLVSKKFKVGYACYNICTGQATSLNTLIDMLSSLLGYRLRVRYDNKRAGDVYCAVGSNRKISKDFNFMPRVDISSGLRSVLKEAGAITLQKAI